MILWEFKIYQKYRVFLLMVVLFIENGNVPSGSSSMSYNNDMVSIV